MESNLEFGPCLNCILICRGWSASRLAREINVDPSYVRRWIRGGRIPALQSQYIKKIALVLHRNECDSSAEHFRNMLINELASVGIHIDKDKALPVLLEDILQAAQIYSLSLNTTSKKSRTNEKEILSILERIKAGSTSDSGKSNAYSLLPKKDSIPHFISGRENILKALIILLKKAVDSDISMEKEIYITFQS